MYNTCIFFYKIIQSILYVNIFNNNKYFDVNINEYFTIKIYFFIKKHKY